jgi:serine/threonine-protein kinase
MARGTETIADRYDLLDVLGRGGMGVVYRARDLVLDRIVAVKVLPAQYASDALLVQRFEREARAAARLNHPNIVGVFDTGRDDAVRYIVMECVPGMSLAERLRERGALPIPEAIDTAAEVADALAAAHAAGIIHRDIKPGNVMIQPSGDCKVLDFGIARAAADATVTRPAALLGSVPYMPPEIALGKPADERSDIYSLGCVLYEMITGRPPFRGDVSEAVIHQQVNAAPRPPSELEPGVWPALDGLMLRMLSKDPAARPQSAAETATALRGARDETAPTVLAAAAAPEAIAAAVPPPPSSYRPPPQRRDDSFIRWLAIGIIVALLAGVAIALAVSGGSGSGHHKTGRTSTTSSSSATSHSSSTPTSTSSSTSSTTPSTSSSSTTSTSTPSTSSSTSTTSSASATTS